MLTMEIPFYQSELECNCGCGQAIRRDALIEKLVIARWHAQVSFRINSWNRCPKHNGEVGGVSDSEHIKGYAVDILVIRPQKNFKILSAAIYAGFRRIGIYSWGFHLGTDPDKPQNVIWYGGNDG